jgi:hypothetical protein
MSTHGLEIAASALGFLGGVLLSWDAIHAVRRIREQRGNEEVEKAMSNGDDPPAGQSAATDAAYSTRLSFARKSVWLARIGFIAMTLGFLLDLFARLWGA